MMSTITAITIHRKGDNPVFGNSATVVSMEDEAAGIFFKVSQCSKENQGHVLLELDEIKAILKAAKRMAKQEGAKEE